MMKSYDVIVIGSGTAGQTVAYELNKQGLSVAVAEKSDRPGGVCALSGCQAKKWFYEGAEIIAKSHHLKGKGIRSAPLANWSEFLSAKNAFTAAVPGNTIDGFDKAGIDFIAGTARFTAKDTITINDSRLTARFFVIATGAYPMPLPVQGAEHMITSWQFLDLPSLPARFVFIGGGFISFEFAHFVARLGDMPNRQTTILEASSRPLGPFDAEMVSLLAAASMADGIDIQSDVKVTGIQSEKNGFRVITDKTDYMADMVVHGAGRIPSIDDLNLDIAGVDYSKKGITVNSRMQTTNPKIYAVGDCAATIQLARVADHEAIAAAGDIAGNNSDWKDMDYTAVPFVLFSYPQYAMVGKTEQSLVDEGVPFTKSFGKNLRWPTYRRVGMEHAAYKLLVDKDGYFLGAHILSDNATGLINTIRMAMLNRITADTLYRQHIMSPYPSRESDLIYMLKSILMDHH
jgi:glutathione reductase (NADPH)